jgi:hypothetical protein
VPVNLRKVRSPSGDEFHNIGAMNYVVHMVVTDDSDPVKHMSVIFRDKGKLASGNARK